MQNNTNQTHNSASQSALMAGAEIAAELKKQDASLGGDAEVEWDVNGDDTEEVEKVIAIDTSKTPRPSFDKKKLISAFEPVLHDIALAGFTTAPVVSNAENGMRFARKMVIDDMAKILGIYMTFFHEKPVAETTILMDVMRKKCRVAFHPSQTPFHMLSRIYRNNDAKQASGDAKVLIQAYGEKIREKTFPNWVETHGGLDAIKKGVTVQEAVQKKEQRAQVAGSPESLHKRVINAVTKVADAKQRKLILSMDADIMPEGFDVLRPSGKAAWKVVVTNVIDGKLCFHELTDYLPEAADKNKQEPKVPTVGEEDWDMAFAKQKAKIAGKSGDDTSASAENSGGDPTDQGEAAA